MKGKSVILTTHSLPECEALAQKIGMSMISHQNLIAVEYINCQFDFIQLNRFDGSDSAIVFCHFILFLTCCKTGIMVGGRLRCLGTSTHLKSRFASGFQLDLNFEPHLTIKDTLTHLQAHLQNEWPGTKVVEQHQFAIKFRVPRQISDSGQQVSIGNLFRVLESFKEKYYIREYACQQTSLEQIFISFAAQQEEERGSVAGITM